MEANENPYRSPNTSGPPLTRHQAALKRLSLPAVGLLFASTATCLGIGMGVLACALLFYLEKKPYAGSPLQICLEFSPLYLVMLGCSAAVAYSAIQMRRGRRIHICFAGAILSLLPGFTPGLILGIPFGLWALLLLFHQDTRAAFSEPLP